MIVIDAAAMFEMLFQTVKDTKVEQRVFASGESLQAPDLLDLEVTQVLRRNLRAMRLQFAGAQQAFEDFLAFKYKRYAHDVLLRRIWSLRDNLAAYDAAYVALADDRGHPCQVRQSGSIRSGQ